MTATAAQPGSGTMSDATRTHLRQNGKTPNDKTLAGTYLLVLLAGMALLDRPFGWIGVPGLPLYLTEIGLVIGLISLVRRPEPLRGLVRTGWLAPILVVLFLGWGFLRLAGSLGNPLVDTLRDAALVYYALFAFLAYALTICDRRFRPDELLRIYGRFVPVLLVLAPFRLVFAAVPSLAALPPRIPGSDITLLGGHRSGNLAVHVACAVVYLASSGRRDAATVTGIVGGLLTIMLIGTQNRGGVLAAGVVFILAIFLWGRRLHFRWGVATAVVVGALIVASALDLRVTAGARELSVPQLMANVGSLVGVGPKGPSQLTDTEDFRSELWHKVLASTIRTGHLENGWGFGVNLGSAFLPVGSDNEALRNPHNSHLTILVRLGLVGAVLWIAFVASWLRRMVALARWRRRAGSTGDEPSRRLALLLVVGVCGILVNAFVDPTLEGPMVALWLWTMVGLGMALVVRVSARKVVTI
jgi:O-antigen ligase